MTTLNDIMEFDHVVFVDEHGHVHDHNTLTPERAGWSGGVIERTRLYAPELIDYQDGNPMPENGSESLAGVRGYESVGSGTLGDPRPHTAPTMGTSDRELQEQARSSGWDGLLTGFTGQYSYNGPCMHESEYVGGGLERYILANPGWYCVTTITDGDSEEDTLNGWAIAYKDVETDIDGPWVDVVFADGDDYSECADMGTDEMVEYLSQWDYGQETDDAHTSDTYTWGSGDTTWVKDGYVCAVNYHLGYASLNRRPMGQVVTP